MVLPFIAFENYAYRQQSFSLNRNGDNERVKKSRIELLRDYSDPKRPMVIDDLSITVTTYGWNDFDMRQRQMCPLLTRKWARSVCDNPWAAIQQALPRNRFRLVDLRHLQIGDRHDPVNCIDSNKPRRELPKKSGETMMVCEAKVYGGDSGEYHSAVVRIDGDLGALWMVWRDGQNDETAEAMMERERGKRLLPLCNMGLAKARIIQHFMIPCAASGDRHQLTVRMVQIV